MTDTRITERSWKIDFWLPRAPWIYAVTGASFAVADHFMSHSSWRSAFLQGLVVALAYAFVDYCQLYYSMKKEK